jgi:hypothetical protein
MMKTTKVKCPHPYGTKEADLWWEDYFKIRIAEVNRENQEQAARIATSHGHDFDLRDRVCRLCGMQYSEYVFESELQQCGCGHKALECVILMNV